MMIRKYWVWKSERYFFTNCKKCLKKTEGNILIICFWTKKIEAYLIFLDTHFIESASLGRIAKKYKVSTQTTTHLKLTND